ncbi:hypothetical protein [Microvirga brassicacearum]|uniref:hypothetical protein n=1 Tax=Microvirga brassicacearum TaxID=2580413 RepID=UPI001914A70D|nr:hypothetical protein [Microvirga brassicacearum]
MFERQSSKFLSRHAYNAFRNREWPALICAVPQDRPVPDFITAEGWFVQPPAADDQAGLKFREHLAQESAQLNGFYLYFEPGLSHCGLPDQTAIPNGECSTRR